VCYHDGYVSILVVVLWWRTLTGEMRRATKFYVGPCKVGMTKEGALTGTGEEGKGTTPFVKAALWDLFTKDLKEFTYVHIFGDNGPQHFGTQEAKVFVAVDLQVELGKVINWNNHAAGHAKGLMDAMGAVAESTMDDYVTSMAPGSNTIRNINSPEQIVNVLNDRMRNNVHAQMLDMDAVRYFLPGTGVTGLVGIRRFTQWIPLDQSRTRAGFHGCVGCRHFGGEGPVYVQHFMRDKPGSIMDAMNNGWEACLQQQRDEPMEDEEHCDGESNPGESEDEEEDDDQAQWERAELKRETGRMQRQRKKDLQLAIKAVFESLDDEDAPGPGLGDGGDDLDGGDDGGEDASRADGVLFEKYLPEADTVIACFADSVHTSRGNDLPVMEGAVFPHKQPAAPDSFILWRCDGDYQEGQDGVHYLGGHLVTPLGSKDIIAKSHSTGEPLTVVESKTQKNCGHISAARVFSVEVECNATDHNHKSTVPAKEFRELLKMGMSHMGRVVGVMPPTDQQNWETVLLFLVTHEDNENPDNDMKGFWLQEVVNDMQGTGLYWLADADHIQECNVLELPRVGREYAARMQLMDTVHVHQNTTHLLWKCLDLEKLQNQGGKEIAKPGLRRARLVLAGQGVRNP